MSIFTKLKVGQKWTSDDGYKNPFGKPCEYDEIVEVKKGWVRFIRHGRYTYEDIEKNFWFKFIRKQIK